MQQSFFEWLQNTPPAVAVGEVWFPWVESAHVVFLAAVAGSILMVDARLLGMGSRHLRLTHLAQRLLPLTWIAFVGAATTGGLLFMANATSYIHNDYFLIKMGLLVVLGLNMLYFHVVTYRSVDQWDTGRPPPAARTAGLVSTFLWLAVVATGRWIGFDDSFF
jgi:hypothetical protein